MDIPTRLPVFQFGNQISCTYCGDPAQHRDHVVAVAAQSVSRDSAFALNGPWTFACADCNGALGDRYFDSFKQRCEWARDRIENKVKPIEWHWWEICEFDYGLKTHIKHSIKKRKWLRNRADWYGSRSFYLNLESLIWECGQLRRTGAGSLFLLRYFSSMLEEASEIYNPKHQ